MGTNRNQVTALALNQMVQILPKNHQRSRQPMPNLSHNNRFVSGIPLVRIPIFGQKFLYQDG